MRVKVFFEYVEPYNDTVCYKHTLSVQTYGRRHPRPGSLYESGCVIPVYITNGGSSNSEFSLVHKGGRQNEKGRRSLIREDLSLFYTLSQPVHRRRSTWTGFHCLQTTTFRDSKPLINNGLLSFDYFFRLRVFFQSVFRQRRL